MVAVVNFIIQPVDSKNKLTKGIPAEIPVLISNESASVGLRHCRPLKAFGTEDMEL